MKQGDTLLRLDLNLKKVRDRVKVLDSPAAFTQAYEDLGKSEVSSS